MSWGAVIGAGASLAGAALSSGTSSDAANAQVNAANGAIGISKEAYADAKKNFDPYLRTGTAANDILAYKLGLDPTGYAKQKVLQSIRQRFPDIPENWEPDNATIQQYMNSPEFAGTDFGSLTKDFTADDLAKDVPYSTSLQFGLDEGLKAVNRGAASSGALDSGAAIKAATRYATDYAGTKATDAYNRFASNKGQIYGMLSGQTGQGLTAASGLANLGAANANNVGNLMTQQGNANAAGIAGSSNAISGGLSGAYNSYNNNRILDALTGGGARGGSSPQISNASYQAMSGGDYGVNF